MNDHLPNPSRAAQLASNTQTDNLDVLICADFTRPGERAFRLSEEIRLLSKRGFAVGLVQTREPDLGKSISPEIQTCLRRRMASVVDANQLGSADLLIVHEPSCADWAALPLSSLKLSRVMLVCYSPSDFEVASWPCVFPENIKIRRVPVNSFVRGKAPPNLVLEKRNWLPLRRATGARRAPKAGSGLAIGWLATRDLDLGAYSEGNTATQHFLLEERAQLAGSTRKSWPILGNLSLDRLTSSIDVLVIGSYRDGDDLPDTLVAAALAAGSLVVAPTDLEQHYGRGPIYFAPDDLCVALGAAVARASATVLNRSPTKTAQAEFVVKTRTAPLLQLAGKAKPTKKLAAIIERRPVLCLASNGVGVGHLTRLLSIARHLESDVVFATQAPAIGVVEKFGFLAEYISSAATVGGDFDAWDDWFKAHLDRLLDTYDPSVVAYDGNHPSWGLIESVASRRDCRLVWVRRGMWANTTSQFLDNARWCDLVMEPGDLAEDRDDGITVGRRHEVVRVDPIRLLEEAELLDRDQAAGILGLNPHRAAVLIQLGSGFNRDLLSMLDQIIVSLTAVPGLQIAVAEWVNGTVPLTLWPNVRVLRGFPISQYIRAFDFCISAAGYNSFHELIGFSMPTIFVANRHPSMDDQYGRAKFAQDSAAAFEISEADLAELPDLVSLLMHDQARRYLVAQCQRLARPNGSIAAAAAIQALVQHHGNGV